MDAEAVASLLGLPAASRVDRRVPKSMLAGGGASTAADRRLISDAIESLHWVAALKPVNCGVATYSDAEREYLEIQVLRLEPRGRVTDRLRTVIHRAIPYPAVLVVSGAPATISAAHIRWSQGERGTTVLDSVPEVAVIPGEEVSAEPRSWWAAARSALALAAQPVRDLYALYDGWREAIVGIRAAERTGVFRRVRFDELATRREALADCERIEKEIARVRAAARRTPQRSRQVTFTEELRRLERELLSAAARI